MPRPCVSVFIPAYNCERFIGRTIESLQQQTFTNWEAIIVDDCSSDNTFNIISKFSQKDARIIVYQNEENIGMMGNWNRGVLLCQADYFAKLDGDDKWHPQALEEAVRVLDGNLNIGLVAANFVEIDENDEIKVGTEKKKPLFIKGAIFSAKDLVKRGTHLFETGISQQGVLLLRKKLFAETGLYQPYFWGDQELWFRVGVHYDSYWIESIRYYYRKWGNAVTNSHDDYQLASAQKGFYDCRKAIFDYYFQHGKLSRSEYQTFSKDNLFTYQIFLIYQARLQRHYGTFVKLLLKVFFLFPIKSLCFYTNRILKR